jgi:hypothetical protein
MHGPGFMSLWDSTIPLACNDPGIEPKPLPDDLITPPAPATTRVPGPDHRAIGYGWAHT